MYIPNGHDSSTKLYREGLLPFAKSSSSRQDYRYFGMEPNSRRLTQIDPLGVKY